MATATNTLYIVALLIVAAILTLTVLAWIWIVHKRAITLHGLEKLRELHHKPRSQLSVIIPGRNVEDWVEGCLSTLLMQRGVGGEVIFVDDGSEDGTGGLVLGSFLRKGVKYMRVGEPPADWWGKNWACWRGFQHSSNHWLLFMDADTRLLNENVLADALAKCELEGLDALSLIPRLDTGSLPSKIMLPLLQNILWSLFPPTRSNDPRDPTAFLFGAFILINRRVYSEVGGHKAVRSRVLEDRALASLLKRRGYRMLLLNGSERIVAEYAGSLSGYISAIKRLVGDYAATHSLGQLKYFITGAFIQLLLPQLILVLAILFPSIPLLFLGAISVALNIAANLLELRRLRVRYSLIYAPLTLLANWVLVLSLIDSYLSVSRRRIELTWRGRRAKLAIS
ncbi:MAG: glycosyltransferase family 2 protein [Nitrososphaerota archaeon]